MKKILSSLIIAASLVFTLTSCEKVEMGGADLKTLSLSYDLDGNTLPTIPSEGQVITKAVVINQGGVNRDVEWEVSVDNAPSWVKVEKTTVQNHFNGTYGGDDCDITLKGVTITVDANDSGAKRSAVIRYTVADGSSISTMLTQSK
ncbi:MAG: hypothetical protein MJZ09_05040 [Bacteroidales bacterium]|nr:hypothetical protein [Bacteroidales bacterium]